VWLVLVTLAAFLFTSSGWKVMGVAALMTLLEDIYFSFGSLFLALRKAVYNVSVGLTVHTLFLIAFLISMEKMPSLDALLGVHLLRAAALAVAAILLTQRRIFRLALSWDASYLRLAVPFVVIALLHAGRDQIGTLLLGFLASYDAVAQYNLAFRVMSASLFIPTAICAVLVPILVADKLSARNRGLLLKSGLFVAMAGLAISIVVTLFAERVAAILYGPMASEVVPVLRTLAFVFPVTFVALFLSLVLQALYQEKRVLGTLIAVTAANVILSFALIPPLGARGAVLAQLGANTVQLVLLGWVMLRITRHPEEIVEGQVPPVPVE
jgi:O-antigen/teichoic acid export membrane protein